MSRRYNDPRPNDPESLTIKMIAAGVVVAVATLALIAVLIMAPVAGWKTFNRYQRLADERNQVQVNDIQISQTEQLVKVEQQKAQIRIAEAQGIAQSQDIINKSLTPLYLQHEAIQAQLAMANGTNHTVIYIPVEDGGIPLIRDTSQDGK